MAFVPIPREIGYKRAVGQVRNWNLFGRHQFDVLVGQGLLPHHRLLEIGCGSLRAARFLIPYLDERHYFGVEPNAWLVEEGVKHELGEDVREAKLPHFSNSQHFSFSFGTSFDYILCHSIFCHAALWQVEVCLRNARRVLSGVLLGTFHQSDRDSQTEEWSYPMNVSYRLDTIKGIAEGVGFSFSLLPIVHPGGKVWFQCQ